MKKLYSFLLILMTAILLMTGCASNDDTNKDQAQDNSSDPQTEETEGEDAASDEAAFPVELVDGTGEKVTIEEKPEKIVSIIPSATEIAFALDLGEQIIGVSDNDNYPEEVADKEKVGGMELNVEKIISLEPELVLADLMNDPDGLQQIRDAGIPVLVAGEANNFDDVYEVIEMIGKGTGTTDKATEIIDGMKSDLAALQEKAGKIEKDDEKNVFVEVSPEPEIYTTGKNTFMDELLNVIHANNVAGEEEGWIKLNEEAILSYNPDVIIVAYNYMEDAEDAVLARAGWEDVQAIKDKQVFEINEDIVSRPGPRLVEGAEELAKAIYPEIFED